ncbi:hypothetical protein D3C83_101250 [compost metagenome]
MFHRYRDGFEPLRAVLVVGSHELRHFPDAGGTVRRPKLDQHHLAAQIVHGDALARERNEGHRWRRRPVENDREEAKARRKYDYE